MADEQGLNVADGFFARGELGETVKAQLVNVGVATRRLPPQDSAPAGAEPGDLAVQDGGNWDPVSNSGNAAVIVYDGSAWNLVADIGSDLS
jgi:hypothetical protein